MIKKAFTLSEALITLAIIGVLAAILIPVLDNARPDKDKVTYKKALYNMQGAVSNAMDSQVFSMAANSAAYWKDENISADAFCQAIAGSLNTSGKVNCTGTSSYDNPNFITTDGIRYWGLEGKFSGDSREIFVDRPLSANERGKLSQSRGRADTGMKMEVSYDGKVITPEGTGSYDYENELIENSLQVTKQPN